MRAYVIKETSGVTLGSLSKSDQNKTRGYEDVKLN